MSSLTAIQDYLERNYNTKHIKDTLLAMPSAIAAQKAEVRRIRDTFREADLPRQMMELEMIDDIAAAVNPQTGKALFSNDKLRDAELKRRKAASVEYQELQKRAREAERQLSGAEDELAMLEQKFAAYLHVSNFVAAEMMLVAGLMKVPGGVKVRPEVPEGTGTWKQPTGQPY